MSRPIIYTINLTINVQNPNGIDATDGSRTYAIKTIKQLNKLSCLCFQKKITAKAQLSKEQRLTRVAFLRPRNNTIRRVLFRNVFELARNS